QPPGGNTDAIARAPDQFYRWLDKHGASFGARDPVGLAELLHYNLSGLDSFPDGNGRTARLMADLALLKHDRAPARYSQMETYFEQGSPHGPASREAARAYFATACAWGQALVVSRMAARDPAG